MNPIEVDYRLRDALEGLRQAAFRYKRALATAAFGLNRKAGITMLDKGPRFFLAYCSLIRIMKAHKEFFSSESYVLVVRIPRHWCLEDMETVVDMAFYTSPNMTAIFKAMYHSPRNKRGKWEFTAQHQLAASRVLVIIEDGVQLHPEVELAADSIVALDPMADDLLLALTALRNTGPLNATDKQFLRTQGPGYLDSIFRKGRPASEVVRRLEQMAVRREIKPKSLPMDAFGEAGGWAHQLRKDIEAWRAGTLPWTEVERGILLYGPPGTGKTSFAVSIAAFCGVPLVSASLAVWQSAGHLGDLLKAMYRDFDEARGAAPSFLLIDEIDAIGDRRKFSGENAQYCNEVVNALLECLDGALGREGVIVIGASNFPERLDPALLRPGRLEKHLELAKPRARDRLKILQHYLPEIPTTSLEKAAIRLQGKTGADIEYIARRARQKARQEQRSVGASDVDAALPPVIQLSYDDDYRICLHEAAHTVLAHLLGVGDLEWVAVFDVNSIDNMLDSALGQTMIKRHHRLLRTETDFRNDIAMKMGGMAVEELYTQGRSTTSGGPGGSDLAEATSLAVEMITSFGLGKSLCVLPDRMVDPADPDVFLRNPGLTSEIQGLLDTEYQRAKELLETHCEIVFSVADALRTERRLSGPRLEILLSAVDPVVRHTEHTASEAIGS